MELHDDEPTHFKTALKFIYTGEYENEATSQTTDEEKVKVAMGVYKIADKYDIKRLYELITKEVKSCLEKPSKTEHNDLITAIEEHYCTAVQAYSRMGATIASALLDFNSDFTATHDFHIMLWRFPMFSADIAWECHARSMFRVHVLSCLECGHKCYHKSGDRGTSLLRYCGNCGKYADLNPI
jgi:hypothetical protein